MPPAQRGRGFLYRQYLARNGWTANPLTSANPLAAEWGVIPPYTWPNTDHSFVQTYPYLVYWQNVVTALRTYARQKYNKEIYITANGAYPFADFQTVGLWDGNQDAPDQSPVEWLPVTASGSFDGTVSWQPALQGILARNQTNGGGIVPVVLFIDWPTSVMSAYYGLDLEDRQDYMRLLSAEAYANGLAFALPVKTSISTDPTAEDLGMMPLFEQLITFYKSHGVLYRGAHQVAGSVSASAPNLMTNLTAVADHLIAHLVNHNYSGGMVAQNNVSVTFPAERSPVSVTLVSPDYPQDLQAPFTWNAGQVRVTVPQLTSYVAIAAKFAPRVPRLPRPCANPDARAACHN